VIGTHRIAWLPRDLIGIEVLEAGEIMPAVLPLPRSRQAVIDPGDLIPFTRQRLLQTIAQQRATNA